MATKKKQQPAENPKTKKWEISYIPVAEIRPSEDNPRGDISDDSVKELAESIKVHGILQPVTIRLDEDLGPEPYVMVCGHRRHKACQILGLDTIPAIIREDLDDVAAYDLMIVENLQRKDLDPLDEAIAYKSLIEPYPTTGYQGTTIKELAARFGKSEKYIRGRLSLNDLIDDLKDCLKAGTLTLGAALRLATLPENMQQSFYEDNEPAAAANDQNIILSPMNIDQVSDYMMSETTSIDRRSFGEDPDEKWNTQLHKCAGCAFNSASQGALFADMVAPGECCNSTCMESKTLAYARYVFEYWLGNFSSAERHLDPGDIVLYIPSSVYWGNDEDSKAERALFELLKDRAATDKVATFKPGRYEKIWDVEKAKARSDVFRVLNLEQLCKGYRDYISYYIIPSQASGSVKSEKVEDHYSVYSKLIIAKSACADKIYAAMQPMAAAALESYFSTASVAADLPEFLQLFIAYEVINSMSYTGRHFLLKSDNSNLDDVKKYLREHSLSDIFKAALMDFSVDEPSGVGKSFLGDVMTGLADDATRATISDIRAEFQPKIDSLVEQLRNMGYDEHNEPLQVQEPEPEGDAEDESNDNDEAES